MKLTKLHLIITCILAVALVAPAGVPFISDEEQQLSEQEITLGAGPLLPFSLGFIIGFTVGWALNEYTDSGIAGETEELRAQARAYEADIINTILSRDTGSILRSIDGFADIWEFTYAHWMRAAELAAVELWAQDVDYTDDVGSNVLEQSGLMINLAQFFENIEYGPDSSYALLADRLAMWKSNQATYSPMSLSVKYGSTALTNSDYMDIHICNAAYNVTSGKNTVWLDNRDLWVYGQNCSITAILNDGSSATYNLQKGYNDLSTLRSTSGKLFESGYYNLQTGISYAGSIVPCISSTSADIITSAVIEIGKGNYSLAACTSANQINYITSTNYSSGNSYSSLDVIITQDSTTHYTVDMLELLEGYSNMIAAAKASLEKSNIAAAAAWNIFTRAGSANMLLSPSSFVPPSANVSAEELTIISAMAMYQLAEYTASSGSLLDAADYKLSMSSLDTIVLGDVYDAGGRLMYENAVFSPYVWLRDQTITTTAKTTFNQSSLLAVWGTADTIANVDTSDLSNATLVTISNDYSIVAKELSKQGKSVDSVTLEVYSIDKWHEYEDSKGSGGWDFSEIKDVNKVVAVLFFVIAGICLFLYIKEDDTLLLILAVIFAAIGVFGTSLIVGWL